MKKITSKMTNIKDEEIDHEMKKQEGNGGHIQREKKEEELRE